jgi:hypothetical protein
VRLTDGPSSKRSKEERSENDSRARVREGSSRSLRYHDQFPPGCPDATRARGPESYQPHGACGWFTATDPPQRRTRMTHVSEGSKGGLAFARAPSAELDRAVRLAPVKGICSCRCDVIRAAHKRSRGGGHILLHACTHFPFVILWTSGHLGGTVHAHDLYLRFRQHTVNT